MVIVVNDNERSYDPTVGGLANHLSTLRTTRGYERFLEWGRRVLDRTPVLGRPAFDTLHGLKKGVKDMVAPQGMFEAGPKLAAHRDAILLNTELFARVKAIHDRREAIDLDPEARFLVERYHRDFLRAGALVADANKAELRELNKEEATLTTRFRELLLAETNASAVVVDREEELAGLSAGDIAAAAQAARDRGLKDRVGADPAEHHTAADRRDGACPTAGCGSASCKRRGNAEAAAAPTTRRRSSRGWHSSAPARRSYLGYPTYAAYVLDDQMAKTPANAEKLLTDLAPTARAKALGEAAKIQALIDEQGGGFELDPPTGPTTPRRCARPNSIWMTPACGRTSSWSACSTTACSSPPTSCSASAPRNARTSRSTTRMCACSRS